MKKYPLINIYILCTCIALPLAHAQDLEDNITAYLSINGSMYLQPLADTFGANLNSGLFHGARIDPFGFHIYLGIGMMGALVTEDQKTFVTQQEGIFPGGIELPTVFGDEEGVYVEEIDQNFFGAWDTDFFPLTVPQLTVGSILGTEATLRWLELMVNDDIGDITLFGYGVRHSISQYFPSLRLDLAIGYYRQNFKIGDIVDAHATFMGLQASYSFAVLCLYGGIGFENADLDISYTYSDNNLTQSVHFDMDAINSTRYTIGVALDLPILKVHADYNIASQRVFSAGIGLGI